MPNDYERFSEIARELAQRPSTQRAIAAVAESRLRRRTVANFIIGAITGMAFSLVVTTSPAEALQNLEAWWTLLH